MTRIITLGIAFMAAVTMHAQTSAVCYRSTDGDYWKMSETSVSDKVIGTPQIIIRSGDSRQTFLGWGTCFNELPWDAYNMLSDKEKELFVKRMFNPNGDLRLQKGRISVGANDYARDWYSCDEVDVNTTDFEMKHFNIDRDLTTIIPSIKLALGQNPDMDFFASPWSPPQWMKTNKHYAQRKSATNGCPANVPPYFNDQFIDDPRYYNAYCLYFDKFITAYREQGINITSLCYQNEAYSNTAYPGCSWTAKTTGKFLANYLGPYMKKKHPGVKLIIGTMNTSSLDVYEQILATENIDNYMDAIGFQWEGGRTIKEIIRRHPNYEAIQTESECGSGTFDWKAAAHTFQLANHYLANGVTTYYYWNAILKDKGVSSWGWVQNALVQVDSKTNTPRYTAEYYAYKHYAHLIPAGSKILTTDEANLVTSALTPDGNIVVVIGNNNNSEKTLTLDIDGKYLVATLPAKSFTSYIVGEDKGMLAFLKSEAQGICDIEYASITAEQHNALKKAIDMAGNVSGSNIGEAVNALKDAVADVQTGAGNTGAKEIVNPQFNNGLAPWVTANNANGGDFRATVVHGKKCWNNWSNNFKSMDIYQELSGMEAGAYTLEAKSLCGPGEISDQHVYMTAQCDTATSPVKTVALWAAEGWETQTTVPVVVGTDGSLRVGYASTSGGGTKGWFCVTDFVLTRIADDAAAIDNAIKNAVTRAIAAGDQKTKAAIAKAQNAVTRDEKLIALTELRTLMTVGEDLTEVRNEYAAKVNEAETVADDKAYNVEARTKLKDLITAQKAIVGEISVKASFYDLIRELDNMIVAVRLTQTPADNTDFSFYIKNAGAEKEEGWDLSITNGDGARKSGQHYSGDRNNMYFDSYNRTVGNLWYTGTQTLKGIPNGTYVLKACGRSDGEGMYITAQTETRKYMTEVEMNTGSDGLGNKWKEYTIGSIIVENNILTIGFTNDMYLTGKKFTGTWMSADDFKLYYVSEATDVKATLEEENISARGGKGCIIMTSSEPYQVFNAAGTQIDKLTNLPAGMYIVRTQEGSRKIMVY